MAEVEDRVLTGRGHGGIADRLEQEGVGAKTAGHLVGAGAAGQDVDAGIAGQRVGVAGTGEVLDRDIGVALGVAGIGRRSGEIGDNAGRGAGIGGGVCIGAAIQLVGSGAAVLSYARKLALTRRYIVDGKALYLWK
jgi:hypothetical protein